jgi:hypothetical protein
MYRCFEKFESWVKLWLCGAGGATKRTLAIIHLHGPVALLFDRGDVEVASA